MLKLRNHNIILPKYLEIVKKKGSNELLCAHGWVGARATSSLAAHFALRNTASNSAEKKGVPGEGVASEQTLSHENLKCLDWSGWRDLNPRPQRPERCALAICATPRGFEF